MKIFVFVVILCLCAGEMKEWPTHTLCKQKSLEAYYKSCDPFQDFGLSFSPCDKYIHDQFTMIIGLILRHDINKLRLVMKLFYNGMYTLTNEILLCEESDEQFSFCGRKKGEFIYIDQLFKVHFSFIPKGNYTLEMMMFNEDDFNMMCTNITLLST
ncbi:lymphocyte antigen 86 [Pelodytes ibericus]